MPALYAAPIWLNRKNRSLSVPIRVLTAAGLTEAVTGEGAATDRDGVGGAGVDRGAGVALGGIGPGDIGAGGREGAERGRLGLALNLTQADDAQAAPREKPPSVIGGSGLDRALGRPAGGVDRAVGEESHWVLQEMTRRDGASVRRPLGYYRRSLDGGYSSGVRASHCGCEGRGFETHYPPQLSS